MIKETLNLLFVENCTIQEAAEKLGVDQSNIKDRLLMLEHMGYIAEVCNNSGPKTSACCSCSAASSCSTENRDIKGKAYQLTEKGERICRI
ncbi:hypothetical protein [Methanolobus sp.]|jgi:predicted ArsR family transcriptional regulator|uniref:hypothetical protein n=1 Tax=Methanolobus sp. TaxID=1874737 RepID=UPI002600394C|nr:hypothetical protein [Methanolobus sp.]